jgi:hypothetical protein
MCARPRAATFATVFGGSTSGGDPIVLVGDRAAKPR